MRGSIFFIAISTHKVRPITCLFQRQVRHQVFIFQYVNSEGFIQNFVGNKILWVKRMWSGLCSRNWC